MSNQEIKKSSGRHGGYRPGAGRKPKKNDIVALNPDLTMKQKHYVKARAEGESQTSAAAIAGYSRGTNPYHIENLPQVQQAFRQLFNRKLSDDKLADQLAPTPHARFVEDILEVLLDGVR